MNGIGQAILLFSMNYIIELSSYVGSMYRYVRKYDRFVEPNPLT